MYLSDPSERAFAVKKINVQTKSSKPHTLTSKSIDEVQKGINNNFDWRFGLVILLVYTMIMLHSDIYSFRKKE